MDQGKARSTASRDSNSRPDLESQDPTFCAAAAEADRKVELLGNEVINPLEVRVTDLESLQLGRRVESLSRRLQPYEDYRARAEEAVRQLKDVETRLKTQEVKVDDSSRREIEKQADVIRTLSDQMQQLERTSKKQDKRAAEDALDTRMKQQRADNEALVSRVEQLENLTASNNLEVNKLAMDLLNCLQQGETVHDVLANQLLATLQEQPVSGSLSKTRMSSPTGGVTKPAPKKKKTKKRLTRRAHRGRSEGSTSSSSARSTAPNSETPPEDDSFSGSRQTSTTGMEVPETQLKDDDVEMDEDGDNNDPPYIPGERKSRRTPKPRKFENEVSWEQASNWMRRLDRRPSGRRSS